MEHKNLLLLTSFLLIQTTSVWAMDLLDVQEHQENVRNRRVEQPQHGRQAPLNDRNQGLIEERLGRVENQIQNGADRREGLAQQVQLILAEQQALTRRCQDFERRCQVQEEEIRRLRDTNNYQFSMYLENGGQVANIIDYPGPFNTWTAMRNFHNSLKLSSEDPVHVGSRHNLPEIVPEIQIPHNGLYFLQAYYYWSNDNQNPILPYGSSWTGIARNENDNTMAWKQHFVLPNSIEAGSIQTEYILNRGDRIKLVTYGSAGIKYCPTNFNFRAILIKKYN